MPHPSPHPISILLIEDSEGDAFLISEALAEAVRDKFVISHVPTIEAAEKKYTVYPFQVMLLDFNLPGLSGIEAIEKIREEQPGIPIIVMTGLDDEEKALDVMQKGAQDYLVKGRYGNEVLPRAIRYAIERKRFENKVVELANFDRTTGLINRELFIGRLQGAIALANQTGLPLAVLHIGLRGFRDINATFGYDTGNKLLKAASQRLKNCVMQHDEIARLEGNEFILFSNGNAAAPEILPLFCQKLIDTIRRPFEVDGSIINIGCGIGIATYPGCGLNENELANHAGIALRRTLHSNQDEFQFYTGKLNEEFLTRILIENELRDALKQETLIPYYQPIIDLQTNRICGVETLLRWQHPEKGIITPDCFIPVAEKSDLIQEVSDYVIKAACRNLKLLQSAASYPLYVAINLSIRDLQSKHFIERFSRILLDSSAKPQHIALEITESVLMDDPEHIIRTLEQCRNMGVSIFVDDFGTGYSSLSYLSLLPADVLKIDRSFVKDITVNKHNRLIATSTINLANALGLSVVVEGVETEEQKTLFTELGCNKAQGYYFANPMPLAQCISWLKEYSVRVQ